jgi:NAD-dependent DNA ligase
MLKQGLFPGATITLVKSGDIIPHLELVNEPVFETQEFRDKHYIDDCAFDGVNIKSTKDVTLKRFIAGIHMLNLKDVGTSMAIKLHQAGYNNALDLFEFNAAHLEKVTGRILKTEQKTIDAIKDRFKVIWLDHGKIIKMGNAKEICDEYYKKLMK